MTIEQTPEQRARVEEFQRKHRIVLLTMLFTDVVGSTKLKQLLGERAAIALTERHHALLREILARFTDADEIATAGDSFFMVFAKPSDAVHFSLLAQKAVRELARETGEPVLDRMGIHVGEVFIQDRGGERRDLFGIQIDSAARIMSLGNPDQILLSRFAFDNARLVLRGFDIPGIGELSWLNHGYYELKGVEEPLEVCEVGEAGFAALTPPGDSEKAHRFHAADGEPVLGWRPAAGLLVPDTRWKLERPLGQGGFGEVWLAQHETLKLRRVLKFCFKAERARALKREATLFRVLRERFGEHPNIVAIHDVFFDKAPFYLVTDYVDGPSLDRWTGGQATLAEVPLDQRLELVAQIADALQAAHDSGIIHRDVKPSNVLVADPYGAAPRAKLVDFGIGQVINTEALAGVTRLGFTQTMLYTGSGTGTPLYQAPELFAGQSATTRSDIYSLGVLLWQIVLGDFTRPLASDWTDQIADPLLREDIRRCVAGDPARRFAAAAELAAALRALPERRRAAEEEKARRAELERRAYRHGVVRAGAFAACILAVVAGLAVHAFHQARVAKLEKARAEQALAKIAASEQAAQAAKEKAITSRKAADELITYLQYDVRDTLERAGRLSLMQNIDNRIARYRKKYPPEEGDLDSEYNRGALLERQAGTIFSQGRVAEALAAWRQSLAIQTRLVKEIPDSVNWQRSLSFDYNNVGWGLRAQGHFAEALESYRKARTVLEQLVKEDPANSQLQYDLAQSHRAAGEALRAQGSLAEALEACRKSLAICEPMPDQVAPQSTLPSGVGINLNVNAGSVKVRSLAHRGPAFEEGTLKTGDEIVAVAQAGEDFVKTEGMPLEKVMQMLQGPKNTSVRLRIVPGPHSDWDTPRVVELKRKEIRVKPDHGDWERALAESYTYFGEVLQAQGQLANALEVYRKCHTIREDQAGEGPSPEISSSSSHIAGVLSKQGRLSDALQAFQKSLAIDDSLVKQDPENALWQQSLAETLHHVGETFVKMKKPAEARPLFVRSRSIADRLVQIDPSNYESQLLRARNCEQLALCTDTATKAGRSEAAGLMNEAITILRALETSPGLTPPVARLLKDCDTRLKEFVPGNG